MRSSALATFLATALDLLAGAAPSRADLDCDEPVHRAGTVYNGAPLAHLFTLVNRGPDAVEITDVRSTCGCAAPQLEKRTLRPGEQGTLLLEVSTLALAEGPQSWQTRLVYRERDRTGELLLAVTGDVVTEVLVQPAALTLPAEAPGVREITVTDRRAKPLTIRAADSGTTFLRGIVGAAYRDGAASVQKVRLEVPADCPEGRHDVALHLYTDDPAYREFSVPVTVVKRPRQLVMAEPRQLTFDSDRGRPVPPRTVRLTAADGSRVEMAGVEADHPAVRCNATTGPATTAAVTVFIDHTRLTGDLQATIRVHLVKPVPETVSISVLCVVR